MGVRELQDDATALRKAGIPLDEPIFIIRASDVLSIPAIARYEILARQIEQEPPNPEWFAEIERVQGSFAEWQAKNLDKVKIPD